jgi:hypothetical protein
MSLLAIRLGTTIKTGEFHALSETLENLTQHQKELLPNHLRNRGHIHAIFPPRSSKVRTGRTGGSAFLDCNSIVAR